MGAWGIKALERDEGLDVLDILKNEYVPEHLVMDLGEMIELMKEEGMLGEDLSDIDFLYDNTAMALAELYFQWKDNSKLDYDHEEAIWDKVTGFTASKEALAFLLRQLTDIKNEVPDEDGIREIVDLWKNEDSGEIAPAWLEHLGWLIKRLISEPVSYTHLGREPYFGLELWFLTSFQGKPVWALNREHLAYLIGYLSADLREKMCIRDRYYANHGVPMMKTTQRFYRKYFGLCCEWYLEQKKMNWAADFQFALFPYLVNGIKNHLEEPISGICPAAVSYTHLDVYKRQEKTDCDVSPEEYKALTENPFVLGEAPVSDVYKRQVFWSVFLFLSIMISLS